MFRKKQFLERVKYFGVQNNVLYRISFDEELLSNDKFLFSCYGLEQNVNAVFCYCNMYDVETRIILKNNKILFTPYSLNSQSYNGVDAIIYNKNTEDVDKKIGLLDFSKNEIKWFYDVDYFGQNLRSGEDLFYCHNYIKLKSLSLKTGEYTWETNLAKELTIADESQFRIVQLVGILGNNLWVTYSIDRFDGLLAVNCATGLVSWKSAPDLGVDAINVKRLEEKRVLFGLFGVYDRSNPVSPYFELDGLTGEVRRKGFVESLFKERLIVKDWIYYENKIYFTARREMLTSNYIGVLDYDTLELLWYGEVPGRKGDLKELQVSENRLYVLDAAGTLHIFEETDGENQEFVQEEVVKQLPQPASYKEFVYDVDVSEIEFFQKHPVDSYCVELSGNYATVLLSVLAAIESLTGERIEILEYDSEEEGSTHIKYRILEEVLVVDSYFMEFGLTNKLLLPVNEVLLSKGSVKKLKEFEPLPPDDYLILTYVTEEMYDQYGKAGYGIYEEYNKLDGKLEWIGVW